MLNNESVAESSTSARESADGRASDETLVGAAGPLPKKQGEFGWAPSDESNEQEPEQPAAAASEDNFPARHPADRSTPDPGATSTVQPVLPTAEANASSSSLQSQSSVFKQFLRAPRPLPKIHGVRSSTVLRVALIACTLIASIAGWIVTVTRMNAWNARVNSFNAQLSPPSLQDPSSGNSTTPAVAPTPSDSMSDMTSSSIVFVHVAFGAAVLFQLLMLERSVYRLRAERYAFVHPEEMAASMTFGAGSVMALAPWNRPPLPTYAAALGVRGTGDVEDNIIAAPPPPEYGNTRGSTLLLSAHLPSNLSRPTSQHTVRDALGRPADTWCRPVSYGEDELRQNARRSLDLETALSRLEGMSESGTGTRLTRPESAMLRR